MYVQSNEPTTVGPDANWILNPDTHDPLDFIGPNGLRRFLVALGVLSVALALTWYIADRQRRRRITTP